MRKRSLSCLSIAAAMLLCAAEASMAQDPHPIVKQVLDSGVKPGQPFILHVQMEVKPGMGERFEAAFAPCIAATLKEKGCQQYLLGRDITAPNSYLLYERWDSPEDLAAHLASEHIATLGPALAEVRESAAVRVFVPVK